MAESVFIIRDQSSQECCVCLFNWSQAVESCHVMCSMSTKATQADSSDQGDFWA